MAAIANPIDTTPNLATVADSAFEVIRSRIIRGEMPPGTWLRQRPLARELGVSPMPVVEALRRLENTGLVESVPKWGVRVRVVNVEQWEQLALMRAALEGLVGRRLAELAPKRRDALTDLRDRAWDLDDRLALPPTDAGRQDVVERDLALHRRLAELSGLDLVRQELDRQALIERVLVVARCEIDRAGQRIGNAVSHVELIDVIASGDPDEAERVVRRAVGPHPDMLARLRAAYGDGAIMPHAAPDRTMPNGP